MTYEEFEAEILQLTGINLVLYKEKQMKRRIDTLIGRIGQDGYESYLMLLQSDKKQLQYFLQYITINVTEFFRTREQWEYMAENIIPQLPDDAVIWSCACSTGEEPYSLAISLDVRRPDSNIRIIATDIDDEALEIAKKGEYTERTMENVYDCNIDKYFTKTKDGFRVVDEIKNRVEFRKLNLLTFENFPQDCSLVVCRNVLIYFTNEAKEKLYKCFYDSLLPDGHLFTGPTEQLLRYKDYNFRKERNFLYKKNTEV